MVARLHERDVLYDIRVNAMMQVRVETRTATRDSKEAHMEIIAYAAEVGAAARTARYAAKDINYNSGIDWNVREKIRSIEGHYSKIEDFCVDILDAIGTPEAIEAMEEIWGPSLVGNGFVPGKKAWKLSQFRNSDVEG